MNLPFADYSWPFTQHAKVLQGTTTQSFLAAASAFEGVAVDADKIADVLIKNNVLTPNVRDGKKSPWRDYQQVLAELGLIMTTNLSRQLRITGLGNLLLSGAVTFQQLIQLQCLRYQYPNGQKEISPEFIRRGITIKPGVLCFQILYGLNQAGEAAQITLDECLNFVLPITRQNRWDEAVNAIRGYRAGGVSIKRGTDTQRRNIGDWFDYIGQTSWAQKEYSVLKLTEEGLRQAPLVIQALQIESAQFFAMNEFTDRERMAWFSYFGSLPNWPDNLGHALIGGGTDGWEQADLDLPDTDFGKRMRGKLALVELDLNAPLRRRPLTSGKSAEDLAAALRAGQQKQQAATLLHEELVRNAASDMQRLGAKVFYDPNSFDLLARWPDDLETAFEAKTLVFQTAIPRVRMAVGQLLEYAYRYRVEADKSVELGFIFNRSLTDETTRNFLRDGIGSNVLVYGDEGLRTDFFHDSRLRAKFV